MKGERLKILLLLTFVIVLNSVRVQSQNSIQECTEYCDDYTVYDTINLEYATYVGPNPEEVKYKYITHEYSPAKFIMKPVPSKQRQVHQNYYGDTYCIVEVKPVIFEDIRVVKRPRKYPEDHIEYFYLPAEIEREKQEVECESICGWENSLEFMKILITALKQRDYPIEYISMPEMLSSNLSMAIEQYQKNNNLMTGKLTRETLNHLGIDIDKYLN